MYKDKNTQIANLVTKFNKVVLDVEYDKPGALACMSANDIKSMCVGVREKPSVAKNNAKKVKTADFMELLNQYGLSRPNANTRKHYAYVWDLLHQFCQSCGRNSIRLDEVTYSLLCQIRDWLKKTGRGEATRYKVESYMRTVYHEAERNRMISRDVSPYLDYKIKAVPEKDIETVSLAGIQKVLSLDLRNNPGMERARDMVMASFYLCGANLIDLYNMPKEKNGEAVFIRHKMEGRTQRYLHIKIEKELVDILTRRGGESTMFDCVDHAPYGNYQSKLNKLFVKISDSVGEKVTLERMRRTWATIASRLEVPDRVIDKSMGHVDSSVKDRFYEQYDWGRTAMYNRKIIDYVWEGVVPNSICC